MATWASDSSHLEATAPSPPFFPTVAIMVYQGGRQERQRFWGEPASWLLILQITWIGSHCDSLSDSPLCPSAGSDSTSFHGIRNRWRSNSAQMRSTRKEHFIYGQCSPYPTTLFSAIKARACLWEGKLLSGDIGCPFYQHSNPSMMNL